MWLIRLLACLFFACVVLLCIRYERSELFCNRATDQCVLTRTSLHGSSKQAISLATLVAVEVTRYGSWERKNPQTVFLVTKIERIAFSSPYGYPDAPGIAASIEYFVQDANQPELSVSYERTSELLPHVMLWGLLTLFMLFLSLMDHWEQWLIRVSTAASNSRSQ